MTFSDRVAVITGGGQGIGRAYCLAFAERGAAVVIADLNETKAREVAEEITAAGGRALAVTTDVSDKASVDAMVRQAVAEFGTVDILVNNAAVFSTLKMRPFDEISVEEWEHVFAVNTRGVLLTTQAVAPVMKAKRYGKIVNISSSVVTTGRANYAHYVASKGAVEAFSRAVATELGAFDINVNSIRPHGIVTEVPRETITEDQWDGIIAQQALKRKGKPSDAVGAVLFLASDESDFITGQSLLVDAGLRFN
ncbi:MULTISPECIES: SDR family NAD(P)-dependent oxidoreductase [Actinoalloteichus]|uniref:Ketoreductase domain-containing protein n=1 Tax=Actinoalloteichus fjordicus TaxID=1612552 RepID=A0AAC9PTT1_9PSEU|nr:MULTISPECIES: 3-oxoacyl-ACP reductase family protein [Actinoalloteichus]APU16478.1 dehydrogenase of unknown specificity, short-chain alcohol dehydrogenase like [Actinoalloteichus fjordicus]APU22537.1 dehydrogenase of unknown specificity, short-chain alcohol dehydrogenase like [Actinoalloteichus sp. GBA129-24]